MKRPAPHRHTPLPLHETQMRKTHEAHTQNLANTKNVVPRGDAASSAAAEIPDRGRRTSQRPARGNGRNLKLSYFAAAAKR